MATFYKCDRCGSVMETAREVQIVKLLCDQNLTSVRSTTKEVCTDCMLELYEWLKRKEEHNA